MNRKRQDGLVIGAIHLFTWATVLLLLLILSYVTYRGIWKRTIIENEMQVGSTKSYVVGGNLGEALTWSDLQRIVKGRVTTWRSVTGNDIPLMLVVDDSVKADLAKDLDLKVGQIAGKSTLPGKIKKGTLVIAPSLPKGLHLLKVRDQVLAVNPAVTALVGNKQMSTVTREGAQELLQGKVRMWSDLGGPLLEVVPVSDLASLLKHPGAFMMMDAVSFSHLPEGSVSFLKVRELRQGPNLTLSFLMENTVESGKYGGIRTVLLNTILFILLVSVIAAPLGVASAIYLEEYAKRGKVYHLVSLGIDILGGIPSIIFGLFGMLVFVEKLHWSFCMASGALSVSLMVLPTIVRTSQDAIHAVPRSLREGSLALGATRIETIWKVVVPAARKGIVTGLILALGRAVGETAALIYTVGSGTALAVSPMMPCRTLAMHIYLTITEGQGLDKAFSTALVLMVLVFVFDFVANRLTAGKEKE